MSTSLLNLVMEKPDPERLHVLCNLAENNTGGGIIAPAIVDGARARLISLCATNHNWRLMCDRALVERIEHLVPSFGSS